MLYRRVRVEGFAHTLPPYIVTSDEIERRLALVYDRLGLPAGRLELMSGIRERRFFHPGTLPGTVSGETAKRLLDATGFDRRHLGLLLHGSVCRDRMEPATACGVHHACGLPTTCVALDVSNACLGLLSGMLFVADQIELGRIRAGLVVGTETGRGLVEGTIDRLLSDPDASRRDMKRAFASLTIGSGSAAVLLCDESLSRRGAVLHGAAVRTDTAHHALCAGGSEGTADGRPQMDTDSEALLHAGVALAAATWDAFQTETGWSAPGTADQSSGGTPIDKVVTHQVGRAHRRLLLDRLGLPERLDFPTVETLGNTGAAALPTAMSLAIETSHITPGDHVALLGIGSGLSSVMLGVRWA